MLSLGIGLTSVPVLARRDSGALIPWVGDNGFAINFVNGQMTVRDTVTPAHQYNGSFAAKLAITGTLGVGADGAALDGTNFARFGISNWPYDPKAITIGGEILFDTSSDATGRTIFDIDAGGNDRLNLAGGAGNSNLILSMGLGASAFNLTATSAIVGGVWTKFVAVAGPLGGFIVINGSVVATTANVLSANPAPAEYSGVGAGSALSAGAVNPTPPKARMRNLVVLSRAVSQDIALAGLPFRYKLAAIGDSITDGIVPGVVDDQALVYPNLLKQQISSIGVSLNAGDQGDSTAEMMSRRSAIAAGGTPDIVIIYGGTNDVAPAGTVQASPTPTSTVFAIEAGKGGYYKTDGWIKVGAEQVQVASVATDTITLKTALSGGAPAAGTAVTIDTQKNLTELALYAKTIGCKRILMAGMHYFNWTSGGDTTSVELARNLGIRNNQKAAATAASVPYVDLYEYMRQLILSGQYAQGDWTSWHSSLNNQHLNANGQAILAAAFKAALQAQGWTA